MRQKKVHSSDLDFTGFWLTWRHQNFHNFYNLNTMNIFCNDLQHSLLNLEFYVNGFLGAKVSHTRILESTALAIEAYWLQVKISKMRDRWQQLIPFHEACDVDFKAWAVKVGEWIKTLEESKLNVPDMKFMQDHYMAQLGGEPLWKMEGTNVATEMAHFHAAMNEMILTMMQTSATWYKQIENDVMKHVGLSEVMAFTVERCTKELRLLHDSLIQIDNQLHEPINNLQFVRYSNRLWHRYCHEISHDVEREYIAWLNSTPSRLREQKAWEKKEDLIRQLREYKACEGMEDFVDYSFPDFQDGGFGQFANCHRMTLEEEDIRFIYRICFLIVKLNEFLGLSKPAQKEHVMDAAELKILDRVEKLVRMSDWRGDWSSDRVMKGLKTALGLGAPLDEKWRGLSEQLWSQFKTGRSSDAERSFQITWLSFVGWSVEHQLLSGKAPSLTKKYFPYADSNAYKAINKCTGEYAPKCWLDVCLLLDHCLLNA